MPICFVFCVAMFGRRAIEAGVGEQVFGFVRTTPQPKGTVMKLQIVLADISESSPFQKAGSIGVARSYMERAGQVGQHERLSRVRCQFDRYAGPLSERRLVRAIFQPRWV